MITGERSVFLQTSGRNVCAHEEASASHIVPGDTVRRRNAGLSFPVPGFSADPLDAAHGGFPEFPGRRRTGARMESLITPQPSATRKGQVGKEAPACALNFAADNVVLFHLGDERLDVIAYQVELVIVVGL